MAGSRIAVGVLLFALVCILPFHVRGQETKFLVTFPKEARFDYPFSVSVTAFNARSRRGVDVDLRFRGGKDTSRVLQETTLTFNDDVNQVWNVTFDYKRMVEIQESSVQLVASYRHSESRKTIFISQSGFIFIQTDKPIYTPRQTVRFRIMAVEEDMSVAQYPLKVDILNPQQIIVDRMRYSAEEAFKGQQFQLPREATPGEWSITATYEGPAQTTKKVTFEVSEYVLPRFSADIKIDTHVITHKSRWIRVDISSKYVYGLPLRGSVDMMFGTWHEDEGVSYFPRRFGGQLNGDGLYSTYIYVPDLLNSTYPYTNFPEKKRLYVNANVTERGTHENFTLEDVSVYFNNPFYKITYDKSKTTFKPDLPYLFHVQVRACSGHVVQGIYLQTFITISRKHKKDEIYQRINRVDNHGNVLMTIDAPHDAAQISIKTIVLDPKIRDNAQNTWTITRASSLNNEYLLIRLINLVSRLSDGKFEVMYRGHGSGRQRSKITALVLSRGHIVFSGTYSRNDTEGRTIIRIPKSLFTSVSPSMRLVAYYNVEGPRREIIMDSLYVDTYDVCMEELMLHHFGGFIKTNIAKEPKDEASIFVQGGSSMHVGFVAVDQAVYLLNDKRTLTRESMFAQIDSHDQGKDSGDGNDFEEIIKTSGLDHFVLEETFDSLEMDSGVRGLASLPVFQRAEHSPWRPIVVNRKQSRKIVKETVTEENKAGPSVRKYFPESWLFQDTVLPESGQLLLNFTLPDSITTWSFQAVGMSADKGVCVSRPLLMPVHKPFFAEVRMPYKVTRLEEVKVKVALYNYNLYRVEADIHVTGEEGMCFSSNRDRSAPAHQNGTRFRVSVPGGGVVSREIKVIPLKNGDLALTVDVKSQKERDIVQKKLYVVAEGQRVRKSITFVLDPEAVHAKFKRHRRGKIVLANTPTINNLFDTRHKRQTTTIDLAMPQEIIRGTEYCRISAFGDLMGDIITHAVVESKSLMEQTVMDAEEVMGDLAPTVHALLYVHQAGLSNEMITHKGKRFVRNAVSRLLRYRGPHSEFSLTVSSPPATWLTTFVLKTLCHATSLAYIHKEVLIDNGFDWLLMQIKTPYGTLTEQDRRLAEPSFEYDVMLAAEVIIALMECNRIHVETHLTLLMEMAIYLEENLTGIKKPMVIAKAAYALLLLDEQSESAEMAIKKLRSVKRRTNSEQHYWADEREDIVSQQVPFWYHSGAHASSIEATSYALLVFLKRPTGVNVDAIADWLVAQRGSNGAFIGAMDSAVAIQALSAYSQSKLGLEVDLHCNVTMDRRSNNIHTFDFDKENAILPKSLSNVDVGKTMEVVTKGQGLGQMQVNVEYNMPIDKNQKCDFNVTVTAKAAVLQNDHISEIHSNPLCAFCNVGCAKEGEPSGTDAPTSGEDDEATYFVFREPGLGRSVSRDRQTSPTAGTPRTRQRTRPQRKHGGSRRRHRNRRRQRRQAIQIKSASKKAMCLTVCLRYAQGTVTGKTTLTVEMVSGFVPITKDLEQIEARPDVLGLEYHEDQEFVEIRLKEVKGDAYSCLTFRAVDQLEVGRPAPAVVTVKDYGQPVPSCIVEYQSVVNQQSLQVYCADPLNSNRGECRCYSGLCGMCTPTRSQRLGYSELRDFACKTDLAYHLKMDSRQTDNNWVAISAEVLALNKTGSHRVRKGDNIEIISPSQCYCPFPHFETGQSFYMLSPDVRKLVDRKGQDIYRYLVDENTLFVNVSSDDASDVTSEPHSLFQSAITNGRCT